MNPIVTLFLMPGPKVSSAAAFALTLITDGIP